MKVLVIIGELQKVTDKFDSAVACITDILSKLGDAVRKGMKIYV